MASIIGGKEFKAWVYDELLPELEAEEKGQIIQPNVSMDVIVHGVAGFFDTTPGSLTKVVKGPQKGNEARKIAMYLCQQMGGAKLKDIAEYFNLGPIGSVSFITHQVRAMKKENGKFQQRIDEVIESIVKKAT